jgi:hypothetical protein
VHYPLPAEPLGGLRDLEDLAPRLAPPVPDDSANAPHIDCGAGGLEPRLLVPEGVFLALQLPERPLQLPERIRPLRKRLREVDLERVPLPRAIPARKRRKLVKIGRGFKGVERREGPVERDLGLDFCNITLYFFNLILHCRNIAPHGSTGAVVGAATGPHRRSRGGHRRKKKKTRKKKKKKKSKKNNNNSNA